MKQEIALEIMKTGRNVFLTGSAGTGKSYLLNQYIDYLKKRKAKLAIVAPTGIAASHIGGNTIHSFFGIGLKSQISDQDLDFLLQKKYLHDRLSKLKVLIIDEVSMLSPDLFESIDKILRAFKFSNLPFGGVQLVLSGDFFQLPPVMKEFKEKRFVWQTELWKRADLKILYLEEKYRQSDPELISILDEIRSGEVSELSGEKLKKRMEVKDNSKIKPIRLYTHNVDVDSINLEELNNLDENSHYFEAIEKGSQKNLERIYKTSLVKSDIELKKGALVMFIKNNYEKNYLNGSLGIVVDFKNNLPVVELNDGREILVEREEWRYEDEKGNIKAVVKQIPLRLAWAITIHKSQGMTLEKAEIDLSKTFEVGQGYVAISRVRSYDGLFLKGINNMALQVDFDVLNNDQKFKKESQLIEKKFLSFSDQEVKEMQKNFLEKIGAELEEVEDDDFEEIKKISTYEKTKELVLKKKTIEEIVRERNISYDTILKHLNILLDNGELKTEDLKYLEFNQEILETVWEGIEELIKDDENFLENLKLKPIYDILDGEIEYDDIKTALLGLKIEGRI